ncbi:hypothetical protein HELRODRAFT_168014 [Helobdella robusta]|uniref:Bridge-like lipid transfer protein family member 1 middle region domain-containing protein n=1 Tax=Helobdella robusta TaxID=6412 RepID=T1F025_HELRO|nr:hypothetical protein HELRODRAFT_168014 [Helobdella robusta]ESO10150.1 hypothetical protein HELRODRAFT_168014 [Helobdella robusta]
MRRRYIESATPYLCSVHPSTIVDMLHMKCLNTVLDQEDKNTTLPSCLSDWGDNSETTTTSIDKLQLNKILIYSYNYLKFASKSGLSAVASKGGLSPPETISLFSEFKSTKKVNKVITQIAKIFHHDSEQTSKFRTLSFNPTKSPNIPSKNKKKTLKKAGEVTSISLFAICYNKVQLQLLNTTEIKTTTTILLSNADCPKNKKSAQMDPADLNIMSIASIGNKIGVGRKKAQDDYRKLIKKTNTSTVKCKTFSEARKSNSVIQVDIKQLHLQLRRSKSFLSNLTDPYSLTAIPPASSKVFFKFETELRNCSSHSLFNEIPFSWELYQIAEAVEESPKKCSNDTQQIEIGDVINLLMFECGFEDIKFTSATRTGYMEKAKLQTTPKDRFKFFQLVDKNQPTTATSTSFMMDDSSVQNTITKNASCFGAPKALSKSAKPLQMNVEVVNDKNVNAGIKSSIILLENKAADKSNNNTNGETSKERVLSFSTVEENFAPPQTPAATTSTAANDADKFKEPNRDNPLNNQETKLTNKKLTGDASSFGLQIKTVWFNFAAPPASSKEIKYAANKHDWNLLSTATPSINAWMNPCHKAIKSAQLMFNRFNKRMHSVMACLMTGALDMQNIHLMPKSKYNKTTWESKFLQDDPSCQLVTVMRKFIHASHVEDIEKCMAEDVIPPNEILKNGIMILIRQWKNVLYLPMFDENTYKAKKKVTVTFALPVMDDNENEHEQIYEHLRHESDHHNSSTNAVTMEDMDVNLDNVDIIDESTSLLKAEGGSVQKATPQSFSERHFNQQRQSKVGSGSHSVRDEFIDDHSKQQNFTIVEGSSLFHSADSMTPLKQKLTDNDVSNLTLNSGCTSDHILFTNNINESMNNVHAQQHTFSDVLFLPASNTKSQQKRDLNEWMNKQHEYINNHNIFQSKGQESSLRGPEQRYHYQQQLNRQRIAQADPKQNYWSFGTKFTKNTGSSDASKDGRVHYQASSTFQLIDAQVLFKPLLEAMGLGMKAIKMSSVMEKFGGELSVLADLKEIRIDIVDSETMIRSKTLKKRLITKSTGLRVRPTFLCKSFCINLSMVDVFDFEENEQANKEEDEKLKEGGGLEVGDSGRSTHSARNFDHEPVLLKTVHLLKDTVEQIEVKPTTTKVIFGLTSQSVNQHVNMSLLRLVHQFVTMVENVAKTKSDLQRDTPETFSTPPSAGINETTSPFFTLNNPSKSQNTVLDAPKSKPFFPGAESNVKRKHIDKQLDSVEKGYGAYAGYEQEDINVLPQSLKRQQQSNVAVVTNVATPVLAGNQHKVLFSDIKENTPKCWKTMYHLINLYNNMPEMMKTIERPALSVVEDEQKTKIAGHGSPPKYASISAVLSGLKLQAELQNSTASFTHREKIKGVTKKKSTESSAFVSTDQTTVTLLEGMQSSIQHCFAHHGSSQLEKTVQHAPGIHKNAQQTCKRRDGVIVKVLGIVYAVSGFECKKKIPAYHMQKCVTR